MATSQVLICIYNYNADLLITLKKTRLLVKRHHVLGCSSMMPLQKRWRSPSRLKNFCCYFQTCKHTTAFQFQCMSNDQHLQKLDCIIRDAIMSIIHPILGAQSLRRTKGKPNKLEEKFTTCNISLDKLLYRNQQPLKMQPRL